ncbi:alpha/beta hydrolase-fold protein [Shewanella sp. SP2S2-4]|uniref:alpha/beta hydrolase-fold protein n=1 Tax=Shewanella sp. SP2S2-4 TaxID=3063539 RepID=UPI00288E1EB7|nr:alpha/beta hydrolase-fold protein [Shewanella sp. SP2S2-4]MDT3273793.1 alpha/beta hydrolase-fold protein [Shewanella sp. SP2S2-4]
MRFLISLLFVFTVAISEASALDKVTIGENFIIHSEIIGEDRPISVYIPKGVNTGDSLYVIYLLDSEHHFHTVTGIVQSLVDYEQIPKTMVVGIQTTNRPRDYLPKINGEPQTKFQTFVKSKWPDSGQDKFLKFLNDELFPYIDKNYTTYPHRTIIGHSNGGTLALSALFERPELFNNYLAISANGWWSYDEIIQNSKKLIESNRPKQKLFISVAGEGSQFYTGTLELLTNMERNKPVNLGWKFEHYPERTHMSGILPAITSGLEYLYADVNFKITPELAKYANISVVKSYYSDLSKQFGFTVSAPVDIYVEFAEQQQMNLREEEALKTLEQFVRDYPEHSYAHMKLAQGYAKVKKFNQSYEGFVQALNLAKQQKKETNIIDALQDMVNQAQTKL